MKSSNLLVAIAFLSFVTLGLPSGVLNVTWPAIRTTFALTQDALGALLFTYMVGYMLASFSSGRIVARVGIGTFLMVSLVMSSLGLLGYALAGTWWAMVLLGLVTGMGAGTIDAGMNTYFAANHSPSLMNWLHASFGLGAALGPQLATVIVGQQRSWRWGFGAIACLEGLLALGFVLTLRQWRLARSNLPEGDGVSVRTLDTLRLPIVWLNIAMFFLFVGLETSGGQWSFPLFTEARLVNAETASRWVSIYWASLTIGRILFGMAANYVGTARLLRISMVGSITGTLLIWWNPTNWLGFLGLAVVGFTLAPMFPLLISDTPTRVGYRHTPNAIGFQVAAASIGLAAIPGLAGVLAQNLGLESIGPLLVLVAVAILLIFEVSMRTAARSVVGSPSRQLDF
jgi:fucose permease